MYIYIYIHIYVLLRLQPQLAHDHVQQPRAVAGAGGHALVADK